MTIPKKYEDVVAERDAALAREAALREELDKTREAAKEELDGVKYTRRKFRQERDDLQQRLTVAEQRAGDLESELRDALEGIESGDRIPYNMVRSIKAALKPAAEPHKCIECESQYCHGVCVERGDDDERYKGAEGEGS